MKYICSILVCITTLTLYGNKTLLRDRVVQRNSKQQLEVLLDQIGASSVDDAMKKLQGFPRLCDQFESSSVSEVLNTIDAQGTQQDLAQLLKNTHSSTLTHLVKKTDGLEPFLKRYNAGSIKQVQAIITPRLEEIPKLRKKITDLEQQNAKLNRRHADMIRECKEMEKRFSKMGAALA